MYAGGQLVRNTVDGSRPGYNGKPHGKLIQKSELNKAAKYFFEKGEISSPIFDELNVGPYKNTKNEWRKVYDKVRSAGGKFKIKTQSSEFSATDQAKIKKVYPEAKFTTKHTYGFSPDHPKYQDVWEFVNKRNFKAPYEGGMFKSLPKYAQQELIEAFPEVDFNFDRSVTRKTAVDITGAKPVISTKGSLYSKYGVLVSHPKYDKIAKYFAKTKPWKYKFDLRSSSGWMLQQIERAVAQGNTQYEILTEKGGPIKKGNAMTGFKDLKTEKSYNMKTIVNHPDFDNTRKYWNIADKTSKKYLNQFDNLATLLPEGFDPKRIQVNDLLQFISDKDGIKGLNRAKRAIQLHHERGVKFGTTKNYQLLRQDLNMLANTANNLIKKGGLSNIEKGSAEALAKGVRLNVEGVQYGPEKVSARGDIKSIISQAETEMQKFTKKDWNKFSSLLENLGCPGKASGGRVGFQGGTNCAVKGRYLATKLLGSGTANTEQKQILKEILRMGSGLMRGAGQMLNPKEFFRLRNLVGPGAWAAMGAFEAGAIGYDTINRNTPLNEALSDNWVTGWAMPWTKKEAQIKNLEKANISGSPAMKNYMERVKVMAEYERGHKNLNTMKTMNVPEEHITNQQTKLDKLLGDWTVLTKLSTVKRDGKNYPIEGGEIEFQKAVSDMAGERKAGHYDPSDLRNINEYGYADVGESAFKGLPLIGDWFKQGTPLKAKETKRPIYDLPPSITGKKDFEDNVAYYQGKTPFKGDTLTLAKPKRTYTLKDFTQSDYRTATTTPLDADTLQTYAENLRNIGLLEPRGELPQWYIDMVQKNEKWRQLFEQSPTGLHGARFATGGLANLTRTVAPDSGPMSQGLRSLYINDRDY